ncbi:MAG: hypothetical protein JW904_04930 [Spirochaetales bacterium]|nr:hypothetical protein [Spirochaetales bacterium]
MKKFIVILVLLLLLGGTGFFFGWMNFFVAPDSYGVMVTKTGGYDPVLIGPESGFIWRWENLIPTNMTLYVFPLTPFTSSLTSSGQLPSSEVYSQAVPNSPDFSYNLDFTVSLHVNPDALISLVRDKKLTPETLQNWYSAKKDSLKQLIIEKILELADTADTSVFESSLTIENALINSIRDTVSDIVILSITANESLKLPDPEIYTEAKRNYRQFSEEFRSNEMAKIRRTRQLYELDDIAFERSVIQLEKYGELLNKYPVLLKYLYITRQRNEAAVVVPEIKNLFTEGDSGQQ